MLSEMDAFDQINTDGDFLFYTKELLQEEDMSNNFTQFVDENYQGLESNILTDLSFDIPLIFEESLNTHSQLDSILENDDIMTNQHLVENEFSQNLNYTLQEEIIISSNHNNETTTKLDVDVTIDGMMIVKEQPKPDQRIRYASDGARFLPDSKKHPVTIQLPDLTAASMIRNATFGIVITMVTSTNNPSHKTFVHVNDIKYRTADAIELDHGSIFVPLTQSDIEMCEKSFPRLSIICQKFDQYTFNLTSFDTSIYERMTEKYTIPNEERISKTAKGKQFTNDYDLNCYKIIFQLAVKQENTFHILDIKCETNLIGERKYRKIMIYMYIYTSIYINEYISFFRKNINKRCQTKSFAK
ncbi:hypothetical protein I4U23_007137 [Adineta vaga]|nr:hypothetical protein I4U23_007137 [Adineta vaga]